MEHFINLLHQPGSGHHYIRYVLRRLQVLKRDCWQPVVMTQAAQKQMLLPDWATENKEHWNGSKVPALQTISEMKLIQSIALRWRGVPARSL